MSFSSNYLKLRKQRMGGATTEAGGGTSSASSGGKSPASGGNNFSSNYLALRKRRLAASSTDNPQGGRLSSDAAKALINTFLEDSQSYRKEGAQGTEDQSGQYTSLMDAADFTAQSKYVAKDVGARLTQKEMDGMTDEEQDVYFEAFRDDSSQEDLLYESVNGNYLALLALNRNGYEIFDGLDDKYRKTPSELMQMSGDEVSLFNYIYKTQGLDAAKGFLNYLASDLSDRQRAAVEAAATQQADKQPILSSLDTLVTSPFRGTIGMMGATSDLLDGNGIEKNADYNMLNYQRNAAIGKVSEKIEDTAAGKVGSFLYSTGMSMGESVGRIIASGGNPLIASQLAFSDAAASTLSSAKDRGLSDGQAVSLGIISGAAEALMEKFSLETLLDPDLLADGALKYVLKNAMAEGGEEMSTDLVNTVADILIAQDKSEWQMSIDAYKAQGLSDGEAFLRAFGDKAIDIALSGLGGALSGGAMSGGNAAFNSAANYVHTQAQHRQFGKQVMENDGLESLRQLAEQMAGVTEGDLKKQLAEQSGKVSGGKVKARDVGKLYSTVQSAVTPETMARLETARTEQAGVETASAVEGDTFNADKNTAPEGGYKASEDGKTYLKSTGDVVNIMGVASIKDGSMKLKLEDGRVVDARDVEYGSADEAVVYETVANIGVNALAANMLIENYTPGGDVDAVVYAKGIEEAYMAGTLNIPQTELATMPFAADLAGYQRQAAYQLGELFGGWQTAKAQATIRKNRTVDGVDMSKGKVHFEGDRTKLNETQRASLDAMDMLAKSLGVQIYVFESEVGADGKRRGANGWYDPSDGSIHIDLYAGAEGRGTMLFTVSHELTHFIRQWSPAKFKVLANFLMKQYGEQGVSVRELVQNQIDKAKRSGREISYDTAYEEVIADSMETMLTDGNVVQMMAELRRQDKGLWQKIRDWFKDLAGKLKAVVDAYKGVKPDSAEGRLVADMQDVIVILESLYADALVDASENYNAGAQKNTAESGGVRYSMNPQGSRQITAAMTDAQRAEILQTKSVVAPVYAGEADAAIENESDLVSGRSGLVKAALVRIGEEFDVFTDYDIEDVDVRITLSRGNLRESVTKDANPVQLAKLLPILKDTVKSAVGIESHANRYYYDNTTESFDNLLGGYIDGEYFVPVRFGLKRIKGGEVVLYVVVDQQKIKAEVLKTTTQQNDGSAVSRSAFTYNVPQLVSLVNSKDLLRYLPDDMLSVEQKKIKQEGIAETIKYTNDKNDAKYAKFIASGNIQAAQAMVDSAAKAAGYTIKAYHGTTNKEEHRTWNATRREWDTSYTPITVFRKQYDEQAGHFFSSDEDNAGGYGSYLYSVYLMMKKPLVIDCDGQSYSSISHNGMEMDTYEWADYARKHRYDGVIFRNVRDGVDYGAMSAPTTDYVVFESNRIKSADAITYDNDGNVIPISERFKVVKRDIRYSDRDPDYQKVNKVLEQENEKLKEDVSYLKELVKLQRQVTGGVKFTKTSVEAAARSLKEYANAKGDTKELAGLLNSLYEYVASGKELTWEDVKERAQPAVEWLQEHVDTKSQTNALEYARNREMIAQDLFHQVYDSYWRISTLYTVADVKQREINRLKGEHFQRMTKLREYHREKTAQLKQEHKERLEKVRQDYRDRADAKVRKIVEKHQESRQKGIEGRRKTEMRRKVRKNIRELSKLLNRGTKERNVKEGMRDLVANTIASAEVLFADNYTTDDMIRNGVGVELTDKESEQLNQCMDILAELDNAPAVVDVEGMNRWHLKEVALKDKLNKLKKQLDGVFQRERKRLDGITVSTILGNLSDAYAKLKDAEEDYLRGAYDENVQAYLDFHIREGLSATRVADLRLDQLEVLYKAYTMVLTTVRNANKNFNQALKQSTTDTAKAVISEIRANSGENVKKSQGKDIVNKFSWENTKPIYAIERIKSPTLRILFKALFDGSYKYGTDMKEAADFRQSVADKYGFKSWDMDQSYEFSSNTGKKFTLTLNQIMTIYAYSKRDAAHDHMTKGGIQFPKGAVEIVNEKGRKETYILDDKTAYGLSDAIIGEITSKLTAEQKAFADEMQAYLSDTMGAKGNEVSLALYGIKLFGEKHYFPLRVSSDYLERAKAAEEMKKQGQISIINSGFTHSVKPNASKPIIVDGFMDMWASHVTEMSTYHAMALPVEDFRRVYNYNDGHAEDKDSRGVGPAIGNAYGSAATEYIDRLYKDLNGGVVIDPRETSSKKRISNFKKAATMLSMSVVVQQPSSIGRALALIDAKHFFGEKIGDAKKKELVKEIEKYAPIIHLKQMGGFDTSVGGGAKGYLLAEHYSRKEWKSALKDKRFRDDAMGWMPAKADEMTWCMIWNAAKRETKALNPGMDVNSEAFLQKAGERFTEVIEKTQVYDSVLSRSSYMRSRSGLVQMMTSFMAEPTTTINMVEDAIRSKDKRKIGRTMGAVAASIMLNNLLVSFVYAMRDDDEDETFFEKYSEAFISGMVEDINPLSYYPFLRDINSLLQGYDVERSDMSALNDLADAVKKAITLVAKDTEYMSDEDLAEHYKGIGSALVSIFNAGCSAFGVPAKNIIRDVTGLYNGATTIYKDFTEAGRDATWNSFLDKAKNAALDALPAFNWLQNDTRADKVYRAIMAGDTVYENRLLAGSKTDSQRFITTYTGLANNDPRIKTAAVAHRNGEFQKYRGIINEIVAEGKFSEREAVGAINLIIGKLKKQDGEQGTASGVSEKPVYDAADYYKAVTLENEAEIKEVYDYLYAQKIEDGYIKGEAEDAIQSGFRTQCQNAYMAGEIDRDKAVELVAEYGGKGETEVKKWDFELEYGFSWGSRVRAYRLGKISEDNLIDVVMDIEGEDLKSAEEFARFLDLEMAEQDFDISANDAGAYFSYAEPAGIDIGTYLEYKDTVGGIESDKDKNGKTISGSKKKKVLDAIDALDLSDDQKDALYFASGYKKSTLDETPWH